MIYAIRDAYGWVGGDVLHYIATSYTTEYEMQRLVEILTSCLGFEKYSLRSYDVAMVSSFFVMNLLHADEEHILTRETFLDVYKSLPRSDVDLVRRMICDVGSSGRVAKFCEDMVCICGTGYYFVKGVRCLACLKAKSGVRDAPVTHLPMSACSSFCIV